MDPINPHTGLAASLLQGEARTRKKEEKQGVFSRVFQGRLDESLGSQSGTVGIDSGRPLEEVLDSIRSLGEELLGNPSMENIRNYKRQVKSFMDRVLAETYSVEENEGRMRKNLQRPKYTLVRVIDEKMEKLAAALLGGQKNQMDLLRKLEEIQGLLVDLSL